MRYFPLYNILHGVGLNELLNLLFKTAQLESWSHKIQKYLEGAKSTEQVLTRQLLSSKMSQVTLSTTCREKTLHGETIGYVTVKRLQHSTRPVDTLSPESVTLEP